MLDVKKDVMKYIEKYCDKTVINAYNRGLITVRELLQIAINTEYHIYMEGLKND